MSRSERDESSWLTKFLKAEHQNFLLSSTDERYELHRTRGRDFIVDIVGGGTYPI